MNQTIASFSQGALYRRKIKQLTELVKIAYGLARVPGRQPQIKKNAPLRDRQEWSKLETRRVNRDTISSFLTRSESPRWVKPDPTATEPIIVKGIFAPKAAAA